MRIDRSREKTEAPLITVIVTQSAEGSPYVRTVLGHFQALSHLILAETL